MPQNEYGLNLTGTDLWLATFTPQTTTSVETEDQWEQMWYTTDFSTAETMCPQGFSVGPRPRKPH